MDVPMKIRLKMLGFLQHTAMQPNRDLDLPNGSTLRDLLLQLKPETENNMTSLISSVGEPTRALLVLINGVEAGALKGPETLLREEDEVVLLPAIHGG